MSSLRLEVVTHGRTTRVLEPNGDVLRIGRGEGNDLVLDEPDVSHEHAELLVGDDSVVLQDRGSATGTCVVRGQQLIRLSERGDRAALENGDVIILGTDDPTRANTLLRTAIGSDPEANVVEVRPLEALSATEPTDPQAHALRALYDAQRLVLAADDLDAVLVAVADAALNLVPRATHATIVLRDEPAGEQDFAYVPVLTRVRHAGGHAAAPEGPVRIARSIFRKVIRDRAAVMAADAPEEDFASESMLGASIRSTIGVPLWKGSDIVGVLQVDNRDAPAMFASGDVDMLGVLASNASLAVANARLLHRLMLAEQKLAEENTYLKGRVRSRGGSPLQIIGESPPITELLEQVQKVADTRVTVLIEGETGTGKELVAGEIHGRSRRHDRLFVAQNCAAMPENLLESELFGHRRGAFTGATEDKKGLFELADRGTLFLDEVTEMPPALQAKLLRVLQEGEIRPVGATHSKHVDVRVVAATNRNIETEVREGRFREDLYYRLKVFPLRVPPLRERREDIPALAGHFLSRYCKELQKPIAGYAQNAMELLIAWDWPGNVRELENEVQRVVIQADPDGFITTDLLSPKIRRVEAILAGAGATSGTLKERVERVEKYFLLEALREHDNNKTSAAKALGITREGLHKKLRQLKIG